MKGMRGFLHHKIDIALSLLAVVATVLLFKTSEDPLIPQLRHSLVGGWLTQLTTGNEITFNLSAGMVTAVLTYFLFVRLPESRKRQRIRGYLLDAFQDTKVNLIRTYLSIAASGSYPASLPEGLLDQGAFRLYFHEDLAPGMSRWNAVANGLNGYWLKKIAEELEVLHNELQFALAAIEPRNAGAYSKLKSLAAWTIRSRSIDLSSDDAKPLLRGLWELHTGFNFIDGYTGRDAIGDEIGSI